jgi:hypothetical protein
LDSLMRGRRMDVSTLSNVSKLTGGSGLGDPSRDAVKMLSSGVQSGVSGAGNTYRNAKSTRVDEVAGSKGGKKR